ncbi:MAG: hypothetical protein ACREFQ_04235 [Stellaceae bacterium]
MTRGNWIVQLAAALRRWREDRASLAALARLEPLARAEFEALVRLKRDHEFDSKRRSVAAARRAHIASHASSAHSFRR